MKLILVLFIFTQFNSYAQFSDNSVKELLHLEAKQSHTPLKCTKVKHLMFSTVDILNGQVCSAYTPSQCKQRMSRAQKREQNFKLNIEHTWPQSKGAKEMPANSDMHHLFVTSKESNGKRANHPFCDAYYSYWELDGSIYGFDEYSQDCFEVQDEHKGNTARAIFYFSVRYKMSIDQDQEKVLRRWNKLDPVDENERERNLRIKNLQGNINPFIIDSKLINQVENF